MRRLISSDRVWSRLVTSNEAENPNELYVGMADGGGGYGSANLLKVDEKRSCAREWERRRWFWSEKAASHFVLFGLFVYLSLKMRFRDNNQPTRHNSWCGTAEHFYS